MAENIIIVLINLSWQFILIFALARFILTVFRVSSASIKRIIWLCVVFSPLILFPMNMIASSWALIKPNRYNTEITNPEKIENQNMDLFFRNIRHKRNLSTQIYKDFPKAKSFLSQVSFGHIVNKIPSIILIIWIVGVGRGIILLSFSFVKLRKLISKADRIIDKTIFNEIKKKLGLSKEVYFLISSDIQIPFSTGILRSYVVMPSDLSISNNRLQMIIGHELAHIKHYDNFINIICQIEKSFMFFHPLYRLAMKELWLSSEQMCDMSAIETTGVRDDYAQCLLDFSLTKTRELSVGLGTSKKLITKRIKFILEGEFMKTTRKKLALVLLSSVIAILILSSTRLINPNFAKAQALQKAQIVFGTYRDGNEEIYVMDMDGNNQRNLTKNPATDGTPACSPDGKKIAFYTDRDGNEEIYIMDTDGNNQTRITNNPSNEWDPAWSPDCKFFTFTSDRDGNHEIYIMNADGSNQRRLTNNPGYDWSSAWSPDGQTIAFVSDRDGNLEIYTMDVDGKNIQRLTNNPAEEWFPKWSPDGKKIMFASTRDGAFEIYIMDANGKNQTNLTKNPAHDIYPSWSPDGKMIAFVSTRDGNTEIYLMDADGKNQRNLTNNLANDGGPNGGPTWFDPAFTPEIVSPAERFMSTWGWLKRMLVKNE